MKRLGRKAYGHTQGQREVIGKIRLWLRKRKNGDSPLHTEIARRLNRWVVCVGCGADYDLDRQPGRCAKCGCSAFNKKNVPVPGGGSWTARAVKTVSARELQTNPSRTEQVEKRSLHANDYVNKQQLGMCLRACPARDRLIFETLLGTGMRPKVEFCQLQIRDLGVWNGQHQIDVRKGKRKVARGITIDLDLAAMLRQHRLRSRRGAKLTDPVFLDTRGNALSYRALRERLKKLGERAGVGRLNAYRVRHTFATILYENKEDLYYVAKQMGHKNIQTTRVYVHTTESEESEQMQAFRRHVKEAENVAKRPISDNGSTSDGGRGS